MTLLILLFAIKLLCDLAFLKINDSLKPPLMKRLSEVVSVWDKNMNSWIPEEKQYPETMTNEKSRKGTGEY